MAVREEEKVIQTILVPNRVKNQDLGVEIRRREKASNQYSSWNPIFYLYSPPVYQCPFQYSFGLDVFFPKSKYFRIDFMCIEVFDCGILCVQCITPFY